MSILWRDTMCIDNGRIDEDHKHLVDLVNKFEKLVTSGATNADILVILDQLGIYTCTHFAREESLQAAVGFPGAISHKAEHKELRGRIIDIKLHIKELTNEQLKRDVGGLLNSWLIDHIIQHDRKMRPYVAQMAPHAEKMPNIKHVTLEERTMAWN